MSVHLISSGEASGELDSMLERAANHQESEMDSLLATMLSVLEPLLIVIMGLVVLGDRHGDPVADLPDQPARSLSARVIFARALCARSHKAFPGVLPIHWRRVYKSADCDSWIHRLDTEGGMKVKESEKKEEEEEVEDEDEEEAEEEEAERSLRAETDNVGDPSVEINVEELIHELEVDGVTRPGREQAAKRRLEELMEKKRAKRDLEDFDDYDV